MKIAFVLYEGFSTLDFAGLFEPLSLLKTMDLLPELEWDLCAHREKITNSQGLVVTVDKIARPLEGYDLVVIPGGQVENALQDTTLLDWLESARSLPWMAAVNQGSLLLAAAGLLNGKKVSARLEDFSKLKDYGAFPSGRRNA